ncbi:MAG: LPS assembly lipoprotein LptE [Planctomycetota bacterium]|nr:LptE family protein [Planctomycetaceae bacterium]MDQ3330846.1 LPS assembly lipoprotein LptE [Planctomycetota bacterium]
MPLRDRHAARLFGLLALTVSTLLGCGYTVGRAFDAPVRTVAVPTFTNESFRRGIEQQLTEAVHREIQNRTPFRLARDEASADTRLVGRIIQAEKYAMTPTPFGDPRELELHLAVEVRWEDLRTGQVIACQQMPISPDAIALVSQSSFAPETGQSRATGERSAVENMARQIVDLMESPW